MLKLELNGEDLLKLIETCGKSGVSHLKLGKDIELTFVSKEIETLKSLPLAKEMAEAEKEIELESFAKATAEIRKDDLESMMLTNASKFEELIVSGALEDDEETED